MGKDRFQNIVRITDAESKPDQNKYAAIDTANRERRARYPRRSIAEPLQRKETVYKTSCIDCETRILPMKLARFNTILKNGCSVETSTHYKVTVKIISSSTH